MEDIFFKYRKRLAHIGFFKSAMLGLALSLFAVGAAALILWAARAALPAVIGVTAGAGAAVLLAAVPLLYFKRFRPTDREVARRLDALGLDERYITLYEFKNDASGMAALQRADACARLSSVPEKALKFSLVLHIALLLIFGALFAVGATTASVLAADRPVSAEEAPPAPAVQTYIVTYKVWEEGTGTIEGELVQEVEKGGYTSAVTAVAANGYSFAAWVDENKTLLASGNNPRSEVNVRGDITVYALFEKTERPAQGEDSDGETGGGEDKEIEQGGGESGEDSDNPGPSGGDSEGGGGSGMGSDGRQNNNVIDGTQDYKENFDREKLEDELAGRDIPDDLKDILGDYYDTLKP